MSDAVMIALITGAPGFLLALGAVLKMFKVEKKIDAIPPAVAEKVIVALKGDGGGAAMGGTMAGGTPS